MLLTIAFCIPLIGTVLSLSITIGAALTGGGGNVPGLIVGAVWAFTGSFTFFSGGEATGATGATGAAAITFIYIHV